MERLDNYGGYHPLEFVVLQYNKHKNLEISSLERDREITTFLYCYLLAYYRTYIIDVKDLLLSDDKESQLLGLQICCRDFIDTFNIVMEINYYIINTLIIYIRQALRIIQD